MMRANIEVRLWLGLSAFDFEERRKVTYDLVFGRKSILPAVQAIHDFVKNSPTRLGEPKSRSHLRELWRMAIVEFGSQEDIHPSLALFPFAKQGLSHWFGRSHWRADKVTMAVRYASSEPFFVPSQGLNSWLGRPRWAAYKISMVSQINWPMQDHKT